MVLRNLVVVTVLTVGGFSTAAHAGERASTAGGNSVVEISSDPVDIFDTVGNFLRTEPRASFSALPQAMILHNDQLGLIQINSSNGLVWVDEASVVLATPLKNSDIVCRNAPMAKAKDQQSAAALGLAKCK
jgi:hypothetical protein